MCPVEKKGFFCRMAYNDGIINAWPGQLLITNKIDECVRKKNKKKKNNNNNNNCYLQQLQTHFVFLSFNFYSISLYS